MSLRSEVSAALHEEVERLEALAASWPRRQMLEVVRAAVDEASAILTDAANELTGKVRV